MHAYVVDQQGLLGLQGLRVVQRNRWLIISLRCANRCDMLPMISDPPHVVQPLVMRDNGVAAFVLTPDCDADRAALDNVKGETRLFDDGAEIELELAQPAAVRLVRALGGQHDGA